MPELLGLTAIEELFLYQDSPNYPCSCFVRLHFTGNLNHRNFKASVKTVLERHPLLRSIVVRRGKSLCWSPVESPEPVVQWSKGTTGGDFPKAEHLDIMSEIGLRLFVVEATNNDRFDLIFQHHHSCCDGMGFQEFIIDFLMCYSELCDGTSQKTALQERDLDGLKDRGRAKTRVSSLKRLVIDQFRDFVGVVKYFSRTARPVATYPATLRDTPLPADYPAVGKCVFNQTELSELREYAKKNNGTLNDFLTSQVFSSVVQLPNSELVADKRDCVRMMIPTNLRVSQDRFLPATNVLGCTFLDFSLSEIQNTTSLWQSIHREMKRVRDWNLGYTFLFGLQICRFLPGGIRAAVTKDECDASCVFSNVGRFLTDTPLKMQGNQLIIGNAVLEKVDALPPVAPYTALALTAIQYANCLTITAHFDSRVLNVGDVDKMMIEMKQNLLVRTKN